MSTEPSHLIIVCGHAIWLGGPAKGFDESEWLLESYKKGETPTFIEHIKAGVEALSKDDRSVLVFSGGPTRKETFLSEGSSYRNLAQANHYFGLLRHDVLDPVRQRILTEDRALDSYSNVLFSVVLFWRIHHVWPKNLTIVSHGFKRKRMVDLHCVAIGFPASRVAFVGANPPVLQHLTDSGEISPLAKSIEASILENEIWWAHDPLGVGEVLASKRRGRNVWEVSQTLFTNDVEREQSRLATEILEDGSETLIWDARRPW